MSKRPFITNVRGMAAARVLADMKQSGVQIPISFVVGATAPGVTLDVFHHVATDGFVVVLRHGARIDVISQHLYDAPWFAVQALSDGYGDASAAAQTRMRRMIDGLEALGPDWLLDVGNVRDLRDGISNEPDDDASAELQEIIWSAPTEDVALVLAEAFDP